MNKSDISIVLVCCIALFLWFIYYQQPPPHLTPDKPEHETETKIIDSPQKPNPPPHLTPEIKHQSVLTDYQNLLEHNPITLQKDAKLSLIIDLQTGGLQQAILHDYFEDNSHSAPIILGNASLPSLTVQNRMTSWRFSHAKIEARNDKRLHISRNIIGTSLILEQEWALDSNRPYEIDYQFWIKNVGSKSASIGELQVNCGILTPLNVSEGLFGAAGIDQRIDVLLDNETTPVSFSRSYLDNPIDEHGKKVNWLSVQNKYFATIVDATIPFSGYRLETFPFTKSNKFELLISGSVYFPPVSIAAKMSSEKWRLKCFLGPKEYNILKSMEEHKGSIMQFDLFLFWHFGWMQWISILIFGSMNYGHQLTQSYGMAILFITLCIKILFWPLTHRSTVWSRKMQKMQPLMKEIQDKYKDDLKKRQQKTMELYKEQKLNPLTGCLPIFLQIPVFFALFNVLRSAIELRQANFLWVADLSQPDTIMSIPLPGFELPINPLAILMGVTMIIQQKLTPTSIDSTQQRLMMFMSIFFIFLLYTMPSGLTLYWTSNQIISIGQTWMTNKHLNRKEAKEKA